MHGGRLKVDERVGEEEDGDPDGSEDDGDPSEEERHAGIAPFGTRQELPAVQACRLAEVFESGVPAASLRHVTVAILHGGGGAFRGDSNVVVVVVVLTAEADRTVVVAVWL